MTAIGTHITVPTTPFGQKLTQCLNSLEVALELIRELKSEADSYTGGGVTPANLENVVVGFGSGDGSTVYTDIANIKALIDVATVTNALAQLRD